MVSSEKEINKFSTMLSGVLEMVSIFMEESEELATTLHDSCAAFSFDESKATALNEVLMIKYLPHLTYEGS